LGSGVFLASESTVSNEFKSKSTLSISFAEKSEVPDEDSLMVSDLTDMDEFETKIDLAKAYIDMGDTDAAKDIAQEVLEKGTDAQKQEAQAIIDKLV
jgi:FimV-like protein